MSLSLLGLIVASIAWGASFFLIKEAIALIGTHVFLVMRLVVAGLFLSIVFWKKMWATPSKVRRQGLVLGLVLFVPLWLQTVGLESISSARSSFITSLYVPFTPLIVWIYLKKKVSSVQIFLTLFALAGSFLMNWPSMDIASGKIVSTGDLLTVISAVLFALHMVLVGEWMAKEHAVDGLQLGIWQFIGSSAGAISLLVYDFIFASNGQSWLVLSQMPHWSFGLWAIILYCGIIATCLCFMLQIYCQRHVEASRAALIFALEAPFATIFAFVFVGETVGLIEMVGASFIFLASIWPEKWLSKSHGTL